MRSRSASVLALCLLAVSCGSDSVGQDSVAEEERGTASSLVQDVELVLEGDSGAEALAPTLESLATSLESLAESIEALASSQLQEESLATSLESLAESIEALASSQSQEESLATSLESLAESIEALASSQPQGDSEVAKAVRELAYMTYRHAYITCRVAVTLPSDSAHSACLKLLKRGSLLDEAQSFAGMLETLELELGD